MRPVSAATKRLVARKHGRGLRDRVGRRFRFLSRGVQRNMEGWKRGILRWTVAAVIGLVILTVGLVVFSPIGRIEEVHVVRTDPRLDIEEVLRTLSPLFGRYLVAVSTREVRQLLDAKFRDTKSLEVSKRYPSQLSVRIELDPLVARVKILDPDGGTTGTGATVGFLTERGMYSAAGAETGSGSLPLLQVVDWGIRPEPGALLVTPEFFRTMRNAEEILRTQFGQTVSRRSVYLRAQEFHFTVLGIGLWFDMKTPLEDQLQRYRTFLQGVGLTTAKEYVDLRISDKVIYK
ncbi:MAG: hypothetical protein PHO54_02900 [Candidatus Peribacteraceae bacterium]|nr:hypothetical protein [Candidatus Peribacteraceae bacterium]